MRAGIAGTVLGSILGGGRSPLVHASAGTAVALPAPRMPELSIDVRSAALRLVGTAVAIMISVFGLVAAGTAAASFVLGPGGDAAAQGQESAASSIAAPAAGDLERALASSQPSPDELAAAAMAAAEEQHRWDVLRAMATLSTQMQAEEEAARAAAEAARVAAARPAPGRATSLGRASGYPVGTVLTARITVYGCTGPGGGFCGGMASGVRVFEGAAACSHDLPFGTRFRIHGDPTGRVYECLDRGALGATWVDVFFYNTTAGINWASNLGGTVAPIEIVN